MICYTVTSTSPANRTIKVQVSARDEQGAREAAVAEAVIDFDSITDVRVGWAVDTSGSSAKVDKWFAQTEALGLKSLSISLEGFDPDKLLVPSSQAREFVKRIILENNGYRFTFLEVPGTATYGEAAKAIDEAITKNPDMEGYSSFLETIGGTDFDDETGTLILDVFIGS